VNTPSVSTLQKLAALGVLLNIIAILALTTYPFAFQLDGAALARRWQQVEWVLFYRRNSGALIIDRDLLQNILFFLPLGFCWSLFRSHLTRGRVLLEVTLLGLGLSFSVETLQLFTKARSTQLADVWRNTLGSCLGGALAALGAALWHRWFRQNVANRTGD